MSVSLPSPGNRLALFVERLLFARTRFQKVVCLFVVLLSFVAYSVALLVRHDAISIMHDLVFFVIAATAFLCGSRTAMVTAAVMALLVGPLSPRFLLGEQAADPAFWLVRLVELEIYGFVAGTITEIVRSYVRRTREADARLLQAEKMEAIGRLTGGIAHDFNNMLTAIGGYCELIRLKSQGAEHVPVDEEVSEALAAVDRAAGLTRQLLAISRKQVMEPRQINLNDEIEALGNMLRRIIGDDVSLETRLAPSPWTVNVDPSRLTQVMLNLVVNARDAMPNGGRVLVETDYLSLDAVEASRLSDVAPGDYAVITVRDSGIGIDKESLAHIFEPFYTTKSRGRGTGLGLSTTYGIVRQSGGDIWASSEPGIGTTFKLYLPRSGTGKSPTAVPASAPLAGQALTPSSRVLVVDDSETVRSAVCGVLRGEGFQVLEAKDGGEALRLLELYGETVGVVLTDLIMAGMNGTQIARSIKARWPKIRVIVTSGYSKDYRSIDADQWVADAFLEKPFTASVLRERLRQVLAR